MPTLFESRTALVLGQEGVEKLHAAHVIVFGLGAWAAMRPRHWPGRGGPPDPGGRRPGGREQPEPADPSA